MPPEGQLEANGYATDNDRLVGVLGDDIVIYRPPAVGAPMHRAEALRMAAWIVALADHTGSFPKILAAVRNT